MDDLELEWLMGEAAPVARDDAFVRAVLGKLEPRGSIRLAGLLEGAVVVCGLGLAWKGLESLPPEVIAELSAVQAVGAAAISALLLCAVLTQRGLAD